MSELQFARRVLVAGLLALVLIGLAALLARHPEVPLLVFGSALGGVFLDALARPLRHRLGVPRTPAVIGVALLVLACGAAGVWLAGPRLYEQGAQLAERIPELVAQIDRRIPPALRDTGLQLALPQDRGSWSRLAPFVFGSLGGFFTSSLGILTGALAGFALAIFLAVAPDAYREGALLLLPRERRARLRQVLAAIAHALRRWLLGRAIAMAIVAVLTAIGLAVLGMPLALLLAVVAGLLTFIPYIGPPLAALPALVVALADSPQQALIVAALYWGIQMVENYVVTPVVQGRAVSISPAVLLIAQVGLGVLLGGLGLLLSTPLAVAAIVAIQMLYVQDVLGEPVQVLGQSDPERRALSRREARGLGAR
jgi:predicted PurR-regulated permease PerM